MSPWSGWTSSDTLLLALDMPLPATPIDIDGRRFEPKDELHVTIVGRALGRELRTVLGERVDAATRPAFETLDWSLERTGEGALIETPGRRDDGTRGTVASIVEFVELPAMAHFHRWLGGLLGRQLPVPPPHVTLYTHGCAKGIGIATAGKLRAMTRARFDVDALGGR